MVSGCVEYFTCFEYRIPAKQLCIKNCNTDEIERLLRRRHLERVSDSYAKQAIIWFIELELLKRGKISDAALLGAVSDEFPIDGVEIYMNTISILVAVKTFFTADCLLRH